MPFELFGFTIKKKGNERELLAPTPPNNNDESIIVNSGGVQGTYYNLDYNKTSDKKALIDKYRELSLQSEIEFAIDEIVNQAISTGEFESPVGIVLDKLPLSEEIKGLISSEFAYILLLLDFNQNAYELFKRWYIDGRIYFSIVIDPRCIKDGIQELRYIDPRTIAKVKEVEEKRTNHGVIVQKEISEYYVFNDVYIPADSVATTNSGLIDYKSNSILSYLHKSIKPYNQLRMLEDATVIYRIARAPERRIFKISTGGLPKLKAEQYVDGLMNKYKNKIAYDSTTGDLVDDVRTMSMLEDFWIPVDGEGKGTDITTLPGGVQLGEINDVLFFQKNLFRALNVPVSRLDNSSSFNAGRVTEIDREEVKFDKFIKRLRSRFSMLFLDLLRKQLIFKNIITSEEWDTYIKNNIYFDYRKDSHYAEYNDAEIMSRRMELAQQAISLGSDYYSKSYIKSDILKLSEEEVAEIEIDVESEETEDSTTPVPETDYTTDYTTDYEDTPPEEFISPEITTPTAPAAV